MEAEHVHANVVQTNGTVDILSATCVVTQLLEVWWTLALILKSYQIDLIKQERTYHRG